jgi:hypothetical protein
LRGVVLWSVARRTAIYSQANSRTGCHQDDEENLRLLRTMFRAARSDLLANTAYSRPPCSCLGYLPRPIYSKITHLHGVYGREPVPIDESKRSQMLGLEKCQEHTLSDPVRPGPHPRSPILSSRHQTRKHPGLDLCLQRFFLCLQPILGACHAAIDAPDIFCQDCRLRVGKGSSFETAIYDICIDKMVQST